MKSSQHYLFAMFLLISFTISCAPTKTLQVWKDDNYTQNLKKVLVIAAADQDFMRNMLENIMAEDLKSRNLQAIPSHNVIPQLTAPLDREAILAKTRELGAGSILLARSVKKEQFRSYQKSGIGYHAVYVKGDNFGFYGQGFGPTASEYNSEIIHVMTNIYDVESEKLIWSSLSEAWVRSSKEAVVRPFVKTIMAQLENSKLIP